MLMLADGLETLDNEYFGIALTLRWASHNPCVLGWAVQPSGHKTSDPKINRLAISSEE